MSFTPSSVRRCVVTGRALLALLALIAAITPATASGQAPWRVTPRAARTTDAVIARDLAHLDTLAARAASSRERGYVQLAREAYERNDEGRLTTSLLNAARDASGNPEPGQGRIGALTHPELWQALAAARAAGVVSATVLDSLEFALVRAAHPVLGAPSCAAWAQRAEQLAASVARRMAAPPPAPVAAPSAAAPASAAPASAAPAATAPLAAPERRPGPLPDRVHFALDRADLSARSVAVLTAVADSLRDAGPIRIELEGHTDPRAGDAYNDALSARRAEAVRSWLVQHGVDAARVRVRARGRSQLLVPDTTPEAHARNRRVLMRFVTASGAVLATLEQQEDLQPDRPVRRQ